MRTLLLAGLLHAAPLAAQGDAHAHHAMPSAAPAPPVGPPPPGALEGPAHAADALFPAGAMARARQQAVAAHGGATASLILVDRLEWVGRQGGNSLHLASEGRFGTDEQHLWLKADADTLPEGRAEATLQMLYGRPIGPWFDVEAGVRQDVGPGPGRTHAVIGVHGLAPFWFELSAAAFLSTRGELTGRLGASYDQRITNRLILQPAAEIRLSAQDMPDLGTATGLTSGELGLRLRYEVVPEFAPYTGVSWARKLGRTADMARAAGEETGGFALLLGVRAWF